MTNQELNEAVARKLGHPISGGMIALRSTPHQPEYQIPEYSTSIQAAWEIVEKIKVTELFALCFHDGQWHCEINCCDGERPIDEEADTAPLAICKAFLKLDAK